MGIEYIQWEYNSTHDGNRIYTMGIQLNPRLEYYLHNGNIIQPMMGIEDLQWEYNLTRDGNRLYTMGI